MENTENEKLTLEEKAFEFERYKFRIDVIKWFIASVALVIMTIIIDKGFRERAAGVQEMQAFDRYVETILLADNIESRWKLSEYYAIVTPTERLRKRWILYKDSISSDYRTFKALKNKEEELRSLISDQGSSVPGIEKELSTIQNQLAPFQKGLTTSGKLDDALLWEAQGFSYLVQRDVENAIAAFAKSENAINGFHSVYEIGRYLTENKSRLLDSNSEFWKTAYKKIATDYSWKMPAATKISLIEHSK
jgi:hypothetical protein